MGHGSYDSLSRNYRAVSSGLTTRSAAETFSRSMNNAMNPNGVDIRESRDSAEHPCSVPVIIALDVTGSMGSSPHFLVKEGLPHTMQTIIDAGIADPQVLFLGIGDHECDTAPLQVGQFESSDELLDHWLTSLWLEGRGGGNYGESYHLAWFFGANYTATDHNERRGQKGILITIGDEPVLRNLPASAQEQIMGPGDYSDLTSAELLDAAREKYEVFHLHLLQGSKGRNPDVQNGWIELLGDNMVMVQDRNQVSQAIADIVVRVAREQGVGTDNPPPELDDTDRWGAVADES